MLMELPFLPTWRELVAEGVLVRFADGKMALANYRDYRFDFNI